MANSEEAALEPSDGRRAFQRLGEALRQARQSSNMSLRDLGRRLNRAHSALSDYETGKALAPDEVIEEYARELQISARPLLAMARDLRVERYGDGDARRRSPRAPAASADRTGTMSTVVVVLALLLPVLAATSWYLVQRDSAGEQASCDHPNSGHTVISGLNHPAEVVVAPDGSIDVLDKDNHRLVRVDGVEHLSTIAGTGVAGCSGDWGLAVHAQMNGPDGLARARDGTVFIADTVNRRVRAVTPSGVILTFVGGGQGPGLGDDGPATKAVLSDAVEALAIGPDGTLYIADTNHHRVRSVDSRGVIRTVIGRGTPFFSGDGGPASRADLNTPEALVVAPDGRIFIGDSGNNRVRMIDTQGVVTTVAGTGSGDCYKTGSMAETEVSCPQGLALALDGALYIADTLNHRVRRLDPGGELRTVVGTGNPGYAGDGGAAVAAQLAYPQGLAVAPDGSLYIIDRGNHLVRRVTPDGTITTVAR